MQSPRNLHSGDARSDRQRARPGVLAAERSCGEAVVDLLAAYGVDLVFGIPGVHTLELYRGLARSNITHVLARHEQGAAFMADGYARVTGRPGVCILISGPGVTNAATAIAAAYADSVPMLVISSAIPSGGHGRGWGYLHELTDQAAVTRPFAAESHMARAAGELPKLFARAFAGFASARPRPVHISIPTDVLAQPISTAWETADSARLPLPLRVDVQAAADLLAAARRPALLIGGGGRTAGSKALALAERLNAPVLCTIAGKGAVVPEAPLFAGSPLWTEPGRALLQEADIVLALGTEIATTDLLQERLTLSGRLIRVDIDPAKGRDDRYDTVLPVMADALPTVSAIVEALPRAHIKSAPGWGIARAERCRAEVIATFSPAERHRLTYLDAIREAVPAQTVLVNDMTQLAYTGNVGYPLSSRGRWLYPSGFGTLGYALPAAIGAKLGGGKHPVMAIAGDSGVLYTASEMATAAELRLPLALAVWNNGGLRQIQENMKDLGIPPIGVHAAPPDFRLLAWAFGWEHALARDPDQLNAVLRHHNWQGQRPVLIEISANSRRQG